MPLFHKTTVPVLFKVRDGCDYHNYIPFAIPIAGRRSDSDANVIMNAKKLAADRAKHFQVEYLLY